MGRDGASRAQCAVFHGGFSLEAAEALVLLDPGVVVLDVLQALRDRSLLRCVSDGGAVRYVFFESVRAYALDTLHAREDEFEAANRVHVALTELRRRGLRAWLQRRDARYLLDPALRVEVSDV